MTTPGPITTVEPIDASVMNRAFWEQAADRALKTAVQTSAVFFLGIPIADIDWKQASIAVSVTVFLSFLMSIVASRSAEFESFFIDLAQRAGRTFIATFLGALTTLSTFDVEEWKQAAVFAGTATLLSVLTSGFSKNVGTPGTASLLPGADLVPVPIQVAQVAQIAQAVGDHVADEARDRAVSYMNSLRKPSR